MGRTGKGAKGGGDSVVSVMAKEESYNSLLVRGERGV